jgi:uncharacterized membrane protein YsdA (DUF1294 family)
MEMLIVIAIITLYLFLINIWAFCLFHWDKRAAESGDWRVSESSLLMVTFVGGTIGSMTAQKLFRHKTRKQPFKSRLDNIALLQMFVILALSFPQVREGIGQVLT